MRLRLSLACLLVASAMPLAAQEPRSDTVSGIVLDARDAHPVPHAIVRLNRPGTEARIPPTTTGADGRFTFAAVPAGKYNLSAITRGYFSASYLQHQNFNTDIVTGAGLQTTGLELRITRFGSISGRVLDQAGEPPVNANVNLYRPDPGGDALPYQHAGSTNVDPEGRYSFKRLQPGRYYLVVNAVPWYAIHSRADQPQAFEQYRTSVDPAVDVVYPTTFYQHATNSNDAHPIELQAGEEFTADISLQAEPSQTLTIHLPPGNNTGQSQVQLLHTVFGNDEPLQSNGVEFRDGEQLIAGVPPGIYKVQQIVRGSSMPVSTGATVNLLAGSASLQALPVPALSTLNVTVRSARGTDLPAGSQVVLRTTKPSQQFGGQVSGQIGPKGATTIADLPPGDYTFFVNTFGTQMRTRSLTVDGKPVPAKLLHIAAAGNITAELTIAASSSASTVEGIANRDGKAAAATFVLLIPALARYDNDDIHRDQTNMDGSYTMAGVSAGNYILIAVDEGWKLHWQDPQALIKYLEHGVPVTVPESDGRSIYRVPDNVSTQPR